MTPDDVFVDISSPEIVAEEVASFMAANRDQLSQDFIDAVYQKMYTYGVPQPQPRVFTPAGTQGYPSYSG